MPRAPRSKSATTDTSATKAPRATKAAKAAKAPKAPKARAPRKKKGVAEPGTRGLTATELTAEAPPDDVRALAEEINADGGQVIGTFRDPIGGHWSVIAGLPIEKVEPTPFQRDLSETHAARLSDVIGKMDRFLDPIIAVRRDGMYWTPNGNHRLSAVKRLGGKSITALVLPDAEVAYRILALNTEKAHNLREKALEVIRMARSLAELDPGRPENEYGLEFEEPTFLTLGLCYEKNGRFSGGAYQSMLKRIEGFLADALPKALATRAERSAKLMEIDTAVAAAVAALKERGFQSPYLKAFVVARVNPIRFHKGEPPPFDEVLAKMLASAQKFDPDAVRADQVASAAGPPEEAE